MIDSKQLTKVYQRYGFAEKKSSFHGFRVFTLRSGHFHNADIIHADDINTENIKSAYNEFADAGYACQIRNYKSIAEAESELFQGFFSVDSTRERLSRERLDGDTHLTMPGYWMGTPT